MHGDLIAEVTINREVKVCGGPMMDTAHQVRQIMHLSKKSCHGKSQVRAEGAS